MLCDIVWLQEEIAADGLRIVEPPLLLDDALDDEDFDDALDDIQCAVCGDPECSTEQHTDEWKDGQWQGF